MVRSPMKKAHYLINGVMPQRILLNCGNLSWKRSLKIACLRKSWYIWMSKKSLLQSAVGLLPFSDQTCCGWDLLVWGSKWVCCVCFFTPSSCLLPLFLGCFGYGLRTRLPVMGVDLILGNDFAGVKVFPSPEVVKSHGLYMWLALCCSQPSLCFSCVRSYARQGS